MRRVLVRAERGAHIAEVAAFKVAEYDGVAVARAEPLHRLVENGRDLSPGSIGIGLSVEGVHVDGFLFADSTALFATDNLGSGESCVPVKPPAQHDVDVQHACPTGEIDENTLRDILGEVGVAVDLA